MKKNGLYLEPAMKKNGLYLEPAMKKVPGGAAGETNDPEERPRW